MGSETETMVLTEPEVQEMWREPRPPTGSEARDRHDTRPLMEKLKEHYKDPKAQANVNRLSNKAWLYFWFMVFSEYYVMVRYVVPQQYAEDGEEKIYWVKVWCAWVTIQAAANWLCVRFYSTVYVKTADRPDLRKSLWDDYKMEGGEQNRQEAVVDEKTGLVWRYCKVCDHMSPPRSHHCKICNKCILKRDHHCYFTGVCIGFYNQRYFFFLNFYTMLACITGQYLVYPYMMETFYPTSTFWDWVLPCTLYKCVISGTVEWNQLFMMFQLYSFWFIGIMGFGYTTFQFILVNLGATNQEMSKNVPIRITANYTERFQSVFGAFWYLGFIFPTRLIFKQTGDGVNWDKVKILRRVVRRVVTDPAKIAELQAAAESKRD